MIGQVISHYKIIEKLGEGGMGVVYKAQDTKLGRPVALKLLPRQALVADEDKARFAREAQAAASLMHSNVAMIFEFDEVDDPSTGGKLAFIAMEYVDGETLKQKLSERPLPVKDVVDIAIAVAEGLAKAHEKGIIHRDIKSDNVMISRDGVVKIMDFGLAEIAGRTRVTKEGMTVGTAAYMSPEQAMGEKLDQRTDIWSLGVVMYEMVTGKLPFAGDYEQAIVYRILNEEPEPITSLRSNVPMELERIVKKAMQKERSERYQSVQEFLVDLRTLRKEIETAVAEQRTMRRPVPAAKKGLLYGGAVLLLGLFVVVAVLFLVLRSTQEIDSIAVLPLENLSGNPEQEYLADGLTEALISNLAKISALKVISRTSVMEYKGVRKSLPQIAKALNVDAIVEGSVTRAGDRVRISAQLIEAATDRHLWVESYEREFRDVFSLQAEIARSIAEEIKVTLSPQEERLLTISQKISPEAQEAYLKGRYFLDKGKLEKAREQFEQALKVDPQFALAYAGMADYYTLLPFFTNTAPKEAFPKAKEAAVRALAIDKTLAEGHASLAYVRTYYEWDWEGGESAFKRALDLNPNYATVRHAYSRFLSSQDRLSEARAQILRAKELDPLSLVIHANVGVISYFGREYDNAIQQLEKTLDLDSSFSVAHWGLGLVYEQKGMLDKAILKLERVAAATGGTNSVASLGHAYGVAGRRKKAQQVLNELKNRAKSKYISSYQIALVYAGLGEADEAFRWLQQAYEERSTLLGYLKMDPRFDSLHSDPRYTALLKKVGLEK